MRTLGPGAVVSGYRIERRIGAGGMGSVYLAQHPRLPRKDALKILTEGADAEFRARFLREAELAGQLDHPNIVAIYDCGGDADMLWIAMQFVDGYDAGQLLKQHAGGLPAERAVAIVRGAARGLDAAHRAGLLHRDVKPANILIEPARGDGAGESDAGGPTVSDPIEAAAAAPGAIGPSGTAAADRELVTDFGIARATTESGGLTAVGQVLATLAFAAPEQISGGVLDERTDVYALGGTLYQLLTGTVPFPRETVAAVMHAHLTAPRPAPSSVDPALPAALDSVVARAMSADPADRYRSCGELAEAAAAALLAPIAPTRRGWISGGGRRASGAAAGGQGGRVPPRRTRRGRTMALLAAATGAVVVLAAIGITTHHSDSGSGTAAPGTPPTVAGSPWRAFGFIVDTFPRLLPSTPSGHGYQDLRCTASDNASQAVPIDEVLDQPVLVCSNGDTTVWATCATDRSAMPAVEITDRTQGSEAWSRASGTGTAEWKTFDSDGKPRGQLDIRFDGVRAFCKLRITGANSGRELHDQWWPSAPI